MSDAPTPEQRRARRLEVEGARLLSGSRELLGQVGRLQRELFWWRLAVVALAVLLAAALTWLLLR